VSPISDADLDRLADYTAGLLDAREHDRVSALIATDPAWRDAHTALLAVQPRLDAALAGLAAEPLPVDVAAQLDAALVREGQPADTGTPRKAPSRWRRVVLGTAAAAAVVTAVFGGIAVLSNGGALPGVRSNSGGGGAGLAASPAEGFAQSGGATVLHSGTDYTPQNLTTALGGSRADTATNPKNAAPGPQAAAGADGALARLENPQALRDCLGAILAAHGGTAATVDYARFQGRPALIVVVATGNRNLVVVAGPACGINGAAELYSTLA
jgi:hypothetical protein